MKIQVVAAMAFWACACGSQSSTQGSHGAAFMGDDATTNDSIANDGGTNVSTNSDADASDDGFVTLFDGTTLDGWQVAGQGSFVVLDGNIFAVPGNDLGLLWSTAPTPPNFILRLEYRRSANTDNSGVFLRFPDPNSKGYDNTAYVGVDFGLEVQIDDRGEPDGASEHMTGAIYNHPEQQFSLQPSRPVPEWNQYEIQVQGQSYTVFLNGTQVTHLDFAGDAAHPDRALPSTTDLPRYVGVQSHTGLVSFRNVRIKAL